MDEIDPANLGYRVMDEVAFEITKKAVREKVDNFLKEKDLTPTGQERANLYRINYYQMLFWMMAQPVAKQVPDDAEPEPEGKVLFSFKIPDWVFPVAKFAHEYKWVFEGIGFGCVAYLTIMMLSDFLGKH